MDGDRVKIERIDINISASYLFGIYARTLCRPKMNVSSRTRRLYWFAALLAGQRSTLGILLMRRC